MGIKVKLALTLLGIGFLCRGASAQVFVFRDFNQELLGLVAGVAEGYKVSGTDSPVSLYEEYSRVYGEMMDWLRDTEAVAILKELFKNEVVNREDLPALGIVYTRGFASMKHDYLVPPFMSPMNGATPYVERFVECLRELSKDEKFVSYVEGDYRKLYQQAIDGSADIFDETGNVIIMAEETLDIEPPENFLNFFTLFSEPLRNLSGIVEKTDGSRVAYVICGIGYSAVDHESWFEISPELFLNTYAFCVIDNARVANPGYDGEFYRLYTAKVRETAESSDIYRDIDSYMLANASHGLTSFLFSAVGNRHFENTIINTYQDYYLYLPQISGILKTDFKNSGLGFYEYFPAIFRKLLPAE